MEPFHTIYILEILKNNSIRVDKQVGSSLLYSICGQKEEARDYGTTYYSKNLEYPCFIYISTSIQDKKHLLQELKKQLDSCNSFEDLLLLKKIKCEED